MLAYKALVVSAVRLQSFSIVSAVRLQSYQPNEEPAAPDDIAL